MTPFSYSTYLTLKIQARDGITILGTMARQLSHYLTTIFNHYVLMVRNSFCDTNFSSKAQLL